MELIAQFGLFNGILVLLLILVYSFRRSINKIFLGLSLFCVWHALLLLLLNVTGDIVKYPFLLRTGIISAYLAFPFLYIYSRNTFYPGRLWKKTDWLMFLPALLYVIDFMPFFLLPDDQKLAIWHENLSNLNKMLDAKEGWLGLTGFHFPFAYIWIGIIMYFQLRLIVRNWNLESGFKTPHNRHLLHFIGMITLLYLPLFFPGVLGVLFRFSWFDSRFITYTFGISLTAISVYLLIYPNILYGFLPERKFSFPNAEAFIRSEQSQSTVISEEKVEEPMQPAVQESAKVEVDADKSPAADQELSSELAIVLQHMKDQKPFRQQGFTIQDLSNQTGIPVYQLSPMINGYFKLNFANWVNRYRVEYFIEQAVENQHMTLEAVSKEAGFISRSTFINAFKKEKGVTPKEYIKSLNLST